MRSHLKNYCACVIRGRAVLVRLWRPGPSPVGDGRCARAKRCFAYFALALTYWRVCSGFRAALSRFARNSGDGRPWPSRSTGRPFTEWPFLSASPCALAAPG